MNFIFIPDTPPFMLSATLWNHYNADGEIWESYFHCFIAAPNYIPTAQVAKFHSSFTGSSNRGGGQTAIRKGGMHGWDFLLTASHQGAW
ncbi:hypothetical protein, partial [Faecalibaculum rodentium]|uniref:hypothetical protein n=1 Tax=Faecalibaculum rodentium TaxID=1702221 RepID=UPI0025A1CB12